MTFDKSKFEKYIKDALQEEAIFIKNGNTLTWDVVHRQHELVISRLTNRGMDNMVNSIENISLLPRIAINGMMRRIKAMHVNEAQNGEFSSFAQYLYNQLSQRSPNIRNLMELKKLIKVLGKLNVAFSLPSDYLPYENLSKEFQRITKNTWYDPEFYSSDEEGDDAEPCLDGSKELSRQLDKNKHKLSEIYRDFMLMTSSYPNIEYEGVELANALGIHLIVCHEEMKTKKTFGPNPRNDIPTITLLCKKNENNLSYVLHKVNDQNIPHSITPSSNSIFECFAQAIWELNCQFCYLDTDMSRALRRSLQTFIGVTNQLIPRSTFLKLLSDPDSIIRELTIESLQRLPEDLLPKEVEQLQTLQRDSSYFYVSIGASVTLYCKGDEQQRKNARLHILQLLKYSFTNRRVAPESYIENKAHILTIICRLKKHQFSLHEETLNLMLTLTQSHPNSFIKIKAAEVLFSYGTRKHCQYAQRIIECILHPQYSSKLNSENDEVLKVAAIKAVVNIKNPSDNVVMALKFFLSVSSENLRKAARIALENLGRLDNTLFYLTKTSEGIFITNGEIYLAKKLNINSLASSIAVDHCILQKIGSVKEPVRFIQRYFVSGKRQRPNWPSAAFLQTIIYSIKKYYNISLLVNDEQYLAALYPDINPTLELLDTLLIDFISKTPQGFWRPHRHNMTHFNQMITCHKQVSKDSTSSRDTPHLKVITIIMENFIKCLYMAIAVFKDHKIFDEVNFTEEELNYMNSFNLSQQQRDEFKSKYLGNRTSSPLFSQHLHYIEDKNLGSIGYIANIQHRETLIPYLEEKGFEENVISEKLIKEFNIFMKDNKRYHNKDDLITFLKDLRATLNGTHEKRSILGVAFKGSFFDAAIDSYEDIPQVSMCFSEQFGILGIPFLEILREKILPLLYDALEIAVNIRITNPIDEENRLLCHYIMEKAWSTIMDKPDTVNSKTTEKLLNLIHGEIEKISNLITDKKLKQEEEKLCAYLDTNDIDTLGQDFDRITSAFENQICFTKLSPTDQSLLKRMGKYILNKKMYSCVEIKLLPEINSGWIFPIILKPIESDHSLVSFFLPEIKEFGQLFKFCVAKPCDKFCQPASTAYDLIAEIKSEFSELRGFVGTHVPIWERDDKVLALTHDERVLFKEIHKMAEKFYDEKTALLTSQTQTKVSDNTENSLLSQNVRQPQDAALLATSFFSYKPRKEKNGNETSKSSTNDSVNAVEDPGGSSSSHFNPRKSQQSDDETFLMAQIRGNFDSLTSSSQDCLSYGSSSSSSDESDEDIDASGSRYKSKFW